MKTILSYTIVLVSFAFWLNAQTAKAGGITIITHGLNGNIDGWVSSMADEIGNYPGFEGTSSTYYEIFFIPVENGFEPTWSRTAGDSPMETDSGEILIMLDWSQLSTGDYSTYEIAPSVASALLSQAFISEMNGHALAEFPLHLIGHSRGGSLMSEVSKLLGNEGVWVDHLTTLDPHPLNDAAFPLDAFLYSAVDAPAETYENVLFHDNYFQRIGTFIFEKSVEGAYVRELTQLSGGYPGSTSNYHSNVHLWYHGTIDFRDPASDTEASISSAERDSWYSDFEMEGTTAGFQNSRIGGATRTVTDQPAGNGTSQIRDGYNQMWELGAGVSSNREPLDSNNGNWPNLILSNVTGPDTVTLGGSITNRIYWQWAIPEGETADVEFFLDDDFNPLNGNAQLLGGFNAASSGRENVFFASVELPITEENITTGSHVIYARMTDGTRSRFLYSPEIIEVLPAAMPPMLLISKVDSTSEITITGQIGQAVILDSSVDLQIWNSVITNNLTETTWSYSVETDTPLQFFRARLQ